MEIADRIERLYDSVPDVRDIISKNRDGNFNSYISKIRSSPPQNLELESLDSYKNSYELNTLFTYSPHEKLKKEFGKDILLWTWNKNEYHSEKSDLLSAIDEDLNLNEDILLLSRTISRNIQPINSSKSLKKVYDTVNSFNDFLKNYDLKNELLKNIKSGFGISEKKLEKYSLDQFFARENNFSGEDEVWGRTYEETESYDVYLDAPICVGLMFKDEPCALMSFFPTDNNAVLIKQIQGVNKKTYDSKNKSKVISTKSQRAIISINYNKFFFDLVQDYSKMQGYSKIGIQSSKNNRWNDIIGGKISLESTIKTYNNFAKSIGMKEDRYGNFYKKIT